MSDPTKHSARLTSTSCITSIQFNPKDVNQVRNKIYMLNKVSFAIVIDIELHVAPQLDHKIFVCENHEISQPSANILN